LRTVGRRRESEPVTVYTTALPGGYQLLLGDESERWEALDALLIKRFSLAFLVVALMGAGGGYALTRDMHRRLSAMNSAAQAIIDGDLSRRIPIRGQADDLDRLASTLNRMLDRIETLMESLRQVSVDIAHDLRTPLTRLRQRLEEAVVSPQRATEEGTLGRVLTDLDSILSTFAALLRIAQIDSGGRRAGFMRTDLAEVGRTVVDAFSPSAEDAGDHLILELAEADGVFIDGDAELLIQMLVNLVENAMRHAGEGALISVWIGLEGSRPVLCVTDNGPGVPQKERERLFDRFYRLEQSRSTPGSGLGLALVASVARLHDAGVSLHDAEPGLRVRVRFGDRAG
jgi:signal transduction histidine kinase